LITYKEDDRPLSLKALTCILNSDIAFEWFKFNCTWRGDTLQIDRNVLAKFPLKIPPQEMQEHLERLHDEVVVLKRKIDENTSKFKNLVQNLKLKPVPVHEVVDLTESYIASESPEFDAIELADPLTVRIYRSGEITTLKFKSLSERLGFEYALLVEKKFAVYHSPQMAKMESLMELKESLEETIEAINSAVRKVYFG